MKLNPTTLKRLKQFRSIKRGYYSFVLFMICLLLAALAELWINSRAIVVKYEGHYYFPTYGAVIPGTTFGFDYDYETVYRDLQKRMAEQNEDGFVLMPLVPYNALENDFKEDSYPPAAPSLESKHFLGTDKTGRDVLARVVYGFRIAIIFSLILLFFNYAIGMTVGSMMGFFGGKFDIIMQRLIEIWTNVPFLYVIIILVSIFDATFALLITIMVFFGWTGLTFYMRTTVLQEKVKEYALAARVIGAGTFRTIFHHILPNTISLIVTFIPFSVTGGITSLTSLDYLGFGLPPPTPSWGELMSQGMEQLEVASWIIISVVSGMVAILVMITFIGEGIREAFDPKKYTTYE
ncbi:MAG: peptide ABC transporter permease [Zetaproteobacteria bacterium]|nr:peptide ABC transporter permease [Pseudobdellovibrionaceae bacterium]